MKRLLLALLLALFAATVVFADPPDSRSKYVIILRDPGAVKAKGQAPASAKFNDPDIVTAGGTLLETHGRYRVVLLPPAATAALLRNPAVESIQRVYTTGAVLPDPVAVPGNSLRAGSDSLHSKPDATWDSGIYQYDGAGNIKAIGTGKTYNYDSAGRLVRYAENGSDVETYRYDSFGNLVEKTTGSQTQPIPVDASTNRLQGVQYDLNGNVTVNGVETNAFDPLNMMRRRDTPDVHEHYVYTADDERIAVFDEGAWHITVRDFGAHPMREWFAWDLQSYYIWIEDHVYRDGQPLAADRDTAQGGTRHFHLDHLGTPRVITNSSGYALAQHDYYPFGLEKTAPLQEVETFGYDHAEPLQFTGHERDSRSAFGPLNGNVLDYMHARYYTGGLGRFLSVDPVLGRPTAPQSWNRYAYVENNPIEKVDPDGRCGWGMLGGPIGCALENYVRERGPQVVEAFQAVGPSASYKENVMGAAVLGIVAADAGSSFIEPGEGKAAQVVANAATGKLGEQLAAEQLLQEGKTILGSQVSANTSAGRRVIDHLVQDASGIRAVEVKTGGATRTTQQITKDTAMAQQGATLVGKNAPADLKGKFMKIVTEVLHMFP